MFCPSCGKEIPDNAKFCPKCGESFAGRGAPAGQPGAAAQQATPTRKPSGGAGRQAAPAAGQVPAPARRTPVVQQPPAPAPSPAPKVPKKAIAAIAAVAVVVILAVVAVPRFLAPSGGTAPSTQAQGSVSTASQSDASSGSQGATTTGSTSQAGDSDTALNSNDRFEVTNLKMTTDATNRYVITGTVVSKANEACMVDVEFKGIKHSKDSYGDERKEELRIGSPDSVTPLCLGGSAYPNRADSELYSSGIMVYDLQPGEQRDFTAYPEIDSMAEEWTDISAEISDAKTTGSFEGSSSRRYDTGKYLEVTNVEYSGGVVKGAYVNRSDAYIREGYLFFVLYSKQDGPITSNPYSQRPYGAEIAQFEINNVKPGAEGTFEIKPKKGCDHVEFLHSALTADKTKGGW